MAEEKQLILVAIKGNAAWQVFGPANPKIIAWKKSEYMKSGNWRGFIFELRTVQGFKAVPILGKKKELTFEQKIEKIKL